MPVVAHGKLVGIVSRADFLCALTGVGPQAEAAPKDDAALRSRIISHFGAMPWAQPSVLNVAVHDGVVELSGIVESDAEKRAARVAVEEIAGVRRRRRSHPGAADRGRLLNVDVGHARPMWAR